MAARSTREQIHDQLEKAAETCTRPIEHLTSAHVLSEGRMEVLNQSMPLIKEMMSEIVNLIQAVRAAV